MRSRTLKTSANALLLLAATVAGSKHEAVHEHLEVLHRRHNAHREHHRSTLEDGEGGIELRSPAPQTSASEATVEKRGGQCAFPTNAGLVPVTPDQQNAGWAMSPNQPCLPGNYCPYACPPGQVSMQWDPSATSYTYPQSMNGGLYCDESGNINMPFPNQPYCQEGTTTIGATNNAGSVVAFCQTVLPGNEAMLIPTAVESWTQLAIPEMSYWCSTAAHYYINPPGTTTDVACVWGTNANPWGNWAPYVAGGNTDENGNTFIKLGWNPIYLEQATPFRNTMPTWGVSIECSGEGCNGLPCAIDPTQNGVNEMVGSATNGAGGGAFCVVTVPKGVTANFVVSNAGGSSSSSSPGSSEGGQFYQSSSASSVASSSSSSSPSSSSSSTSATSSEWSSWSSSAAPLQTVAVNTTHTWVPTHSPYYSLFNSSLAATPTGPSIASAEATLTGAYTAPSGPATLLSEGSPSALKLSMASFAMMFVASASVFL